LSLTDSAPPLTMYASCYCHGPTGGHDFGFLHPNRTGNLRFLLEEFPKPTIDRSRVGRCNAALASVATLIRDIPFVWMARLIGPTAVLQSSRATCNGPIESRLTWDVPLRAAGLAIPTYVAIGGVVPPCRLQVVYIRLQEKRRPLNLGPGRAAVYTPGHASDFQQCGGALPYAASMSQNNKTRARPRTCGQTTHH